MRSKVAQRIMDTTPEEVKIYSRLCADIAVRVHDLLKERSISQKDLAGNLDKQPSEISRWLSGDHNFTLRSLARIQAELGEPIINVPRRKTFTKVCGKQIHMTVYKNDIQVTASSFVGGVVPHESKVVKIA